jgi:hypothetical protein
VVKTCGLISVGLAISKVAGLFSKNARHMRKLARPWSDEDTELLKKLHAAGASALRASLALKRSKPYIKARARELGIPFPSLRETKKRQAERERTAFAGKRS